MIEGIYIRLMEGLQNRITLNVAGIEKNVRQYLEGKISCQEAIEEIKMKHFLKFEG